MRIKGRKYISLVLMLMFLISFFPGYALAGETDEQSSLAANGIIQEGLNDEGKTDELLAEPELGEPDQPSTDLPANEPGDATAGSSEQDPEQVVPEVSGAYTLIVKHVLQTQDGQIFEQEEIVPDVQLGSVVSGSDHWIQDLPKGISFMGSTPELLTIQAGTNQITLNYQELPWLEEEVPEGLEESLGQLNEEEMEPYFSDILLDFSSLFALDSKKARMMMSNAPKTTVLDPGQVKAEKIAGWEDYENRIAKITLKVFGEPVLIGADVVLVVDNSGSMGNQGGKVKDHVGTIESPQIINDETSTNIWGTKQTQTRTYSGICQECGKTVTYTSERTRTRPAAWNDWGPWSDWSTPNTTHSVYRMDIAKQASASFVGTVLGDGNPAGNRVALVPFSHGNSGNHLNSVDFQDDVAGLTTGIDAMYANGGTNYTDALNRAKSYIEGRADQSRPAYVVFVSDGAPGQSGNSPNDTAWNGINQANALKAAGVTIYSVGIALPLSDAAALTALATVENGAPLYKNVENVEDLTAVLNRIAGEILNAGRAAVMMDEINTEHFELLNGTSLYPLPENVTIEDGTVKVKWNIGAITKAPKEVVIYVKLKDEYSGSGSSYYTNIDVNLNYIDTEGEPQTIYKEEIGDPYVVVNHTVNFVAGDNGSLTGDTLFEDILDGTAWADALTVPTPAANSGYKFDSWTPVFPATVTESATYTANFVKEESQWHTVTFAAGANGSLTGDTLFEDILDGTAWADALTVPTPAANSGYKFDSWTPGFPTTVTESATYTAKFVRTGGPSGPSGPSGGTAPEEPIEVPEEPEVAIPLNKDDHFAYVVGYPDNTVQPLGKITREEVAAVFYRLLEDEYRETIKTDSSDFPDVGLDRWSSKHIGTLASVDIIIGYPDGNFQPGNTITRAELATIASKFDNLSPFEDNSFSDIEGHWANKYINSAAQKGWVSGYPDGTFKPDQAITRAEFVTLVNKVLERKVLKEDILPDAKQFPDLSPNAWYYVEVQEAVNSHHYERATRQDYEIWTDIYYPELDM